MVVILAFTVPPGRVIGKGTAGRELLEVPMSDDIEAKIAQLEALRSSLGDEAVDAAIAALLGQQTTTTSGDITVSGVQGQGVAAGHGAQATVQKQEAGGNIIGSSQYVLSHIRIAAGGTLSIGQPPADLPPNAEAVREALTGYLRALLKQYRFLSLRGLSTGSQQQARIELQAVFINLLTNVTIRDAEGLFGRDDKPYHETHPGGLPPIRQALEQRPDLRQWLEELLTEDERALLLTPAPEPDAEAATLLPDEATDQIAADDERLVV
jgi:hypothetical protein